MALQPKKDDSKLTTVMTKAFHDHEKGMNRHSFFRVHNRELSEDLVQDTFVKTWSYLVQGGKIDIMRAFLYHALNCLIIDDYRKHKTSSLDILLDSGFEPSNGNASEHIMDVLDGKAAFLLIQRLPEKYQKIMRMRFTQNLSLAEMSLLTGQTKNALAVQIHRGLEKLKVLYNNPNQKVQS